jgi:hypothetical protein
MGQGPHDDHDILSDYLEDTILGFSEPGLRKIDPGGVEIPRFVVILQLNLMEIAAMSGW